MHETHCPHCNRPFPSPEDPAILRTRINGQPIHVGTLVVSQRPGELPRVETSPGWHGPVLLGRDPGDEEPE
jgi:hypothetical protein